MNQLKNISEAKWMMIAFAAIILICACMIGGTYLSGRIVTERMGNMINGEPTSLAEMRERIVEFDVPPGYKVSAAPMIVYDMLMIEPDEASGPMIVLMQYATLDEDDEEAVKAGMRQAAESQNSQGISFKEVDSFDTNIRGELSTVIVSEGNYKNFVMRRWMTIFHGNQGPVILMIQGSAYDWNEDLAMDFIRSIR